MKNPCARTEEALALAAGELDQDAEAAAASHKAGCRACADLSAFVAAARAAAARAALPTVPERVAARAKALAGAGRETLAGRFGLAMLAFDAAVDPAPAGTRFHAPGARQLLYRSGGREVTIRVRRAADGYVLVDGQVIPLDDDDAAAFVDVVLSRSGAKPLATTSDELGEFAFGPVPEGEYDLVVALDAGRIFVESLPAVAG